MAKRVSRTTGQIPAEGPERLIHVPSGMEFPNSTGPETTLGRKDPVTGIFPDVDLTPGPRAGDGLPPPRPGGARLRT